MDFGDKARNYIKNMAEMGEKWVKENAKDTEKFKSSLNEAINELKKGRDFVDDEITKFRSENAESFEKLEESLKSAGGEIKSLGESFLSIFKPKKK